MEKEKRKVKPYRRKWIIAVALLLFAGCCLFTAYSFYRIANPIYRYESALLADIDANQANFELVEMRLLEYLTLGESTFDEVTAFGGENLSVSLATRYDNPHQLTYFVARIQPLYCANLIIDFTFENEILHSIELDIVVFGCPNGRPRS